MCYRRGLLERMPAMERSASEPMSNGTANGENGDVMGGDVIITTKTEQNNTQVCPTTHYGALCTSLVFTNCTCPSKMVAAVGTTVNDCVF